MGRARERLNKQKTAGCEKQLLAVCLFGYWFVNLYYQALGASANGLIHTINYKRHGL
jgi:hypothetical protein